MGSTKIQAAPPADIGKATSDSIRAQMEAYSGTGKFSDIGSVGDLEATHRPQMEGLELQTMQNMLGGVGGHQGLLSMYQNMVQPAMSQIESQSIADRTANEQAMIDQYGPGITDKLREAAGNKELIGQIISDASGEKDPELLNQMVADAQNAYGGQNVINQGPDVLATAVTPGAEAGYVQQGRNALQSSVDGGLLQAGQQELMGGPSALDQRIQQAAMEGLDDGLTSGEQRNFQQAVRQSQSARGMATAGMPSAAAEAFYLADRGADRRMQNLDFARGASSDLENRRVGRLGTGAGLIGQSFGQQLGAHQTDITRSTGQQQLGLQSQMANQQAGLTAQEANRQHGFNVAAQNEANRFSQQQANRGYQGNVLSQLGSFTGNRFGRQMGAAQLAQGTSADPFLALFGRPSQSMGQMQGMGGQAYGMGQGAGPSLFDPSGAHVQMAGNMAMQNNAVQNQVNMANAQSSNSMTSGLIGGAAALGGGMFAGMGAAAAAPGVGSAWRKFWG